MYETYSSIPYIYTKFIYDFTTKKIDIYNLDKMIETSLNLNLCTNHSILTNNTNISSLYLPFINMKCGNCYHSDLFEDYYFDDGCLTCI